MPLEFQKNPGMPMRSLFRETGMHSGPDGSLKQSSGADDYVAILRGSSHHYLPIGHGIGLAASRLAKCLSGRWLRAAGYRRAFSSQSPRSALWARGLSLKPESKIPNPVLMNVERD